VRGVVTLTVVVPASDRPATLARCRAAIEAADDGPEQVVVVDGPPTLSAAAARNVGVARARGDIVVFVDADVEVHRDAFARIRAAYERHPGLTAVFGAYDDAPPARARVSAFRNLLHHHVHQGGAGPAETFWTGLGAVRRAALLEAGGFDEARFPHPSVEDIELGRRLARRGGTILLDPTIQGTHLKRWTLRSMVHTDFARRGVPWVAMQVRERRLCGTLNLGLRHRCSALALLTAVVATVLGRFAVAAIALSAFVALNQSFYRLLARRRGPLDALLGVGLHTVHHLVAILAVPVGIAAAVAEVSRGRTPVAPEIGSEMEAA
jgi:GT2 family glycosyltransferase